MTPFATPSAFELGAGVLLLAAAVSDVRRLVIPNSICLALTVLAAARWVVAALAGADALPFLLPLALAAAVLALGAAAFHLGWLGGGDAKLLAAASLWMRPDQLVGFLAIVALLGGALAVLVAVGTLIRRAALAGQPPAGALAAVKLPYGVAIAAAGLLVLFERSPL